MDLKHLFKNPIASTLLIALMLLGMHLSMDKLSELIGVNYEMIYFTAVALVLLYASIKDSRFDEEVAAVKTFGNLMWFLFRIPMWSVAIGFLMALPVILVPNYIGLMTAFIIYAFLFKRVEQRTKPKT